MIKGYNFVSAHACEKAANVIESGRGDIIGIVHVPNLDKPFQIWFRYGIDATLKMICDNLIKEQLL